jgi:hypothetical protein
MIHLAWSILNTGLIIFYIIICYRATGLVKEKLGIFAATVFALGILFSMSSSNSTKNVDRNNRDHWEFDYYDTIKYKRSFDIVLDNTLISSYNLIIECDKTNGKREDKPIEAYTSMNGYRCGHNWVVKKILIKKEEIGKLNYYVRFVSEWRLFGIKLYSQRKSYEGNININ